ncbi:MAG: HAD family hydrolase [Haloarculaceae archaeon]
MRTDRTYDAVFWDVGGVILNIPSISRGQRAFVERAVDRYDLDDAPEAALERWRDGMREHFADRENGEYRTARGARRRGAETLFDGDPPADWQTLHQAAMDDHREPNPGAIETITALGEAGVYQAIVSDADEEGIPEMLDRFDIADHVSHVTTSEAVGYTKPDQRMFETALAKADVDPARGIMIGDKYRNDMEGGTEAGLATVAYGAEDGPAVDYRIEDLRELLDIVGVGGGLDSSQ